MKVKFTAKEVIDVVLKRPGALKPCPVPLKQPAKKPRVGGPR